MIRFKEKVTRALTHTHIYILTMLYMSYMLIIKLNKINIKTLNFFKSPDQYIYIR